MGSLYGGYQGGLLGLGIAGSLQAAGVLRLVTIGGTSIALPAVALFMGGTLLGGTVGRSALGHLGKFITNTIETGGGNIFNAFTPPSLRDDGPAAVNPLYRPPWAGP